MGLKLGLVQGGVDEANDILMRNPTLIRQEARAAKADKQTAYKILWGVISNKVANRTDKEGRIDGNLKRLTLLERARKGEIVAEGSDPIEKAGAIFAKLMIAHKNAEKKLLSRAKALGITDFNSELAKNDIELVQHRDARAKIKEQIDQQLARWDSEESRLRNAVDEDRETVNRLNRELLTDRGRLENMKREIEDIDGRTEDIISDILGAEEAKRSVEVLKSIDTTAADTRMANLERLRKKAVAETVVANEMSGSPVPTEYLDYVSPQDDLDELNALLNPTPNEQVIETQHQNFDVLPNG
jgi:hypothetical protein